MIVLYCTWSKSRLRDLPPCLPGGSIYRMDGVDVAQETERNQAVARHSWARQHTWQLLNFSMFPVRHTLHPLCRQLMKDIHSLFLSGQTETVLVRFQPKISACFGFLPFWCFGQNTIFGRNSLFRLILAAHFSKKPFAITSFFWPK